MTAATRPDPLDAMILGLEVNAAAAARRATVTLPPPGWPGLGGPFDEVSLLDAITCLAEQAPAHLGHDALRYRAADLTAAPGQVFAVTVEFTGEFTTYVRASTLEDAEKWARNLRVNEFDVLDWDTGTHVDAVPDDEAVPAGLIEDDLTTKTAAVAS